MVSISGQPSGFAYPASKFAVNGTTISLAKSFEVKRNPCQCSCSGNYGNRHDESRSENVIEPMIAQDSASQTPDSRKTLQMHLYFLHLMKRPILQA